MANWFEDLTKTMADDKLPRRQAMRRIAGTVAGMAVASLLPAQAEAMADDLKKYCSFPCKDCSCNFANCKGNPNPNCYCFTTLSAYPFSKGGCGCNAFCSQLQTCSNSKKCPVGSFCATQTFCNCDFTQGVCIPYCVGKNKNCQPGSGHGLTVTGRVV